MADRLWEREDGEMWLETAEDGLLKLCMGDGDFFYTDADELRAMVSALPRRDDAQDVRAALERLMEAAYWATQVHRRAGHDTEHTAADCKERDHILDCDVALRLDRDIAAASAALKREA